MIFTNKQRSFEIKTNQKLISLHSLSIKYLIEDLNVEWEDLIIPLSDSHTEETILLYVTDYEKHLFQFYQGFSSEKEKNDDYPDQAYSFYLSLNTQQVFNLLRLTYELEDREFFIPLLNQEILFYKDQRLKEVNHLSYDLRSEIYSYFIQDYQLIPSHFTNVQAFLKSWIRNFYLVQIINWKDFPYPMQILSKDKASQFHKYETLLYIEQFLKEKDRTMEELVRSFPYEKKLLPDFALFCREFEQVLFEKKIKVKTTWWETIAFFHKYELGKGIYKDEHEDYYKDYGMEFEEDEDFDQVDEPVYAISLDGHNEMMSKYFVFNYQEEIPLDLYYLDRQTPVEYEYIPEGFLCSLSIQREDLQLDIHHTGFRSYTVRYRSEIDDIFLEMKDGKLERTVFSDEDEDEDGDKIYVKIILKDGVFHQMVYPWINHQGTIFDLDQEKDRMIVEKKFLVGQRPSTFPNPESENGFLRRWNLIPSFLILDDQELKYIFPGFSLESDRNISLKGFEKKYEKRDHKKKKYFYNHEQVVEKGRFPVTETDEIGYINSSLAAKKQGQSSLHYPEENQQLYPTFYLIDFSKVDEKYFAGLSTEYEKLGYVNFHTDNSFGPSDIDYYIIGPYEGTNLRKISPISRQPHLANSEITFYLPRKDLYPENKFWIRSLILGQREYRFSYAGQLTYLREPVLAYSPPNKIMKDIYEEIYDNTNLIVLLNGRVLRLTLRGEGLDRFYYLKLEVKDEQESTVVLEKTWYLNLKRRTSSIFFTKGGFEAHQAWYPDGSLYFVKSFDTVSETENLKSKEKRENEEVYFELYDQEGYYLKYFNPYGRKYEFNHPFLPLSTKGKNPFLIMNFFPPIQ